MATPKSVRLAIKTKLDTLVPSKFATVKDYHDSNLVGFPAVTFDISQHDSEYLTNKENLRDITFTLYITQEVKTKGLSEAKRVVDERTEDVINLFANDFSLGGVVEWSLPLEGARGEADSPAGSVFFQQLNLRCRFTYLTT